MYSIMVELIGFCADLQVRILWGAVVCFFIYYIANDNGPGIPTMCVCMYPTSSSPFFFGIDVVEIDFRVHFVAPRKSSPFTDVLLWITYVFMGYTHEYDELRLTTLTFWQLIHSCPLPRDELRKIQ